MGLFNFISKSKTVKQTIIDSYYRGYPVTPYISDDRGEDWLERAKLFPTQTIIPRSMMTKYAEGILPGHVYMLYWLKKYTNKKVPTYFEYKYGIDFKKEKAFLRENGYLDNQDKPTDKGEQVIKKYSDVIENHSPKVDRSIEGIIKQILAQRDKMIKDGCKEYVFIANSDCCEICAKLNDKHFLLSELKIGVNAPPMHEGCSCSIAAYSDDAEYEAWLNRKSKNKKR